MERESGDPGGGHVPERWLVDGNNLFGSRPDGWWRDRRRAARRLVQELVAHRRATGAELTVVFDGPADQASERSGAEGEVVVVYAPGGRDAADERIVLLLDEDRDPSSWCVVTSDRVLAERAVERGARVVGAGAFRRILEASTPTP